MAKQNRTRKEIALIGAGKIGKLTTRLLQKKYQVTVYDIDKDKAKESAGPKGAHQRLDINQAKELRHALKDKEITISCCPYFCNEKIALAAAEMDVAYCDLSEDVSSGKAIERIAKGASTSIIPHCGLAPGATQIIANNMVERYRPVTSVSIRVGALPENPTNALKYNLTWSTDGLINEYGNPCEAIIDGKLRSVQPLVRIRTSEHRERGIRGLQYIRRVRHLGKNPGRQSERVKLQNPPLPGAPGLDEIPHGRSPIERIP